MNLNWSNIDN